ncbi:MAG: radical SAM protein [Hyphomicrobiales bacterium]|nr:radical SAM protein [Hyphomicrobiales bacterium]
MKLTLIKPTIGTGEHSLYVDEGRMEPLNLGVLAALTPACVEVSLFDDRMEDIPFDVPTDLVAITVETYTARRAYEIADEYRARGVKVVLGGFQPTLLPAESARHADVIFIGDAETMWETLIRDAQNGTLKPVYKAKPGIPQPGLLTRRDLYEGKGYLPISLVQFTRGCHFACDFCAVSQYFDRQHYMRNIKEVIEEIESQQRSLVFFVDDNIAVNREALKELCRALIPLKINWVSQASIDITQDLELMGFMMKSGCLGHVIGFESINRDNLLNAKKSPNLSGFSGYGEQVSILRDHGLQTWAAFVLGYDFETEDSIKQTLEFALENHFTFAAFNILMPYPATPLYDRLKREGRLLYDGQWWLHPEYRFNNAAFVPKLMTPEALTNACHEARTRFNSVPSVIRRFLDLKTNMRTMTRMISYWKFTPIFRREVIKKHGMRFGLK